MGPLLALGLLLTGSCSDPVDPVDDRLVSAMLENRSIADAIEWFKTPSTSPNRLRGLTNEQSLALALAFQAKGAGRIVAVAEPGKSLGNPGVTAVGLIVPLPDDPPRRMEIFRLHAKAIRQAGFSPRRDSGQKYLYLPANPEDGTAGLSPSR